MRFYLHMHSIIGTVAGVESTGVSLACSFLSSRASADLGDAGALDRWGLTFERTDARGRKSVPRIVIGTKIIFLGLIAPGFLGPEKNTLSSLTGCSGITCLNTGVRK